MNLTFGSWWPDTDGPNQKDAQGRYIMTMAKNVYPSVGGYKPVFSLANYNTGTAITGVIGGAIARSSSGAWSVFIGTQTKLYKYNSATGNFDDYTRVSGGAYNVPVGDIWSACQFGSKVIFCNFNDNPQVIDIDTGATAFADLTGTPPKARYCGVVGDFVFLACLNSNPRKVRNSAINDTTGWTIGTNLCDEQELPDGDDVTGFAGGEFGWVVQQHAVRRAVFQPGFDQAFRFERVERERGSIAKYSVVGVRDTIFYLADDGFYSLGPAGLKPIGHQRINQWFISNTDQARKFSIIGFSDQTAPRVYWACYASSASTYFDRVLVYDWDVDDFSFLDQQAQFWFRGVTAGTTLEGLNIYGSLDFFSVPSVGSGPGIPYSLDSPAWQGGIPYVAAISTDGHLAFQNSTPLVGLLAPCVNQFIPEARASIDNIYPIGNWNAATPTLRVGRAENILSSTGGGPGAYPGNLRFTSALSTSPVGGLFRPSPRCSGRVHQLELTVTQPTGGSGANWEHAVGLSFDVRRAGKY
jgi:hypothetical protein